MLLIVLIAVSLVTYIVLNNITKKFIWDEMTPMGHQKKRFIRYAMTKVYMRDCIIVFIVLIPVLFYFNVF